MSLDYNLRAGDWLVVISPVPYVDRPCWRITVSLAAVPASQTLAAARADGALVSTVRRTTGSLSDARRIALKIASSLDCGARRNVDFQRYLAWQCETVAHLELGGPPFRL